MPFSQKTFATSLGLSYPLLSDFPHLNTAKSYGVMRKPSDPYAQTGSPLRAFFLIDKQGVIQARWLPGNAGDHAVTPSETILKAARELAKKL